MLIRLVIAQKLPQSMENNFDPKATNLNYSHPSTKHHLASQKN